MGDFNVGNFGGYNNHYKDNDPFGDNDVPGGFSPKGIGGTNGNLYMIYAELQLGLYKENYDNALNQMKAIEKEHEEQKDISEHLDKFRKEEQDAEDGKKDVQMSDEDIDWCRRHHIPLPKKADPKSKYSDWDRAIAESEGMHLPPEDMKGDYNFSGDEWKLVCNGCQSLLDRTGTEIQQQMVMVQDAIGQSNAYLNGANESVQKGNQTLYNLASKLS